jgi:signal transduction histidine kinase
MTAFSEKDLVVRLMRLGCRDFVEKPFGLSDIELRIEALIAEGYFEMLERKRKEQLFLDSEQTRLLQHDLYNMITTTIGYADLVMKDVEENHPARKRLTKLWTSANVAFEISKKLLEMKAKSVGAIKFNIDMRGMIENITAIIKGIAQESVTVRSVIPEQPVWLVMDVERMHHALLNLGMNALDAMKHGGVLTFKLTVEELTQEMASTPSCFSCISVSDTGDGMSKETMEKIFHQSFTTKANGHGIGLPTVKSIVEDHGGRIVTKSEEGKGTEFKLCFSSMLQQLPGEIMKETTAIIL